MNRGFIKLARRTFDHYLWTENRSFSKFEAWLDLLQLAAHSPTKRIIRGHVVEIGRGEIIASLRYLGERWNWKKDKVASFLGLIESDQMVRRSTRQQETVVTICNYDIYNNTSDTEPDTEADTRPTAARQPPDKDKNGKNEKNTSGRAGKPPSPTAISWTAESGFTGVTDSDLEEWKTAYPAVNLTRSMAAAGQWLKANPTRAKKSNWRRFLTNWLQRDQNRGGDAASNRPPQQQTGMLFPGYRPDK